MINTLALYSHLFEHQEDRFIKETFDGEYDAARPKLTVLDIGAFEGDFSFYCLPFAKIIYAFEPDPLPYKVFEESIEDFGLGEVVKLYQCAISGKTGSRGFYNTGGGGSSFAEINPADEGRKTIDTYSLNDFLLEKKIEFVDIVKVDVEGAEKEIFSAPDFPEAASKIKYIIGEDHGGGGAFKDYLLPLGFAVESVGRAVWEARK